MSIFEKFAETVAPETRTLGQWLNDVIKASWWHPQDFAFKDRVGEQKLKDILEELQATTNGQSLLDQVFTLEQKNIFLDGINEGINAPSSIVVKNLLSKDEVVNEVVNNEVVNEVVNNNEPAPEAINLISGGDEYQPCVDEDSEHQAFQTMMSAATRTAPKGWECKLSSDNDIICKPTLEEKERVTRLAEDLEKFEKLNTCVDGDVEHQQVLAEEAENLRLAAEELQKFEELNTCVDGDLEHQQVLAEEAAKLANTFTGCSTLINGEEQCVEFTKDSEAFSLFEKASELPGTHCLQSHAEGAEKLCTTVEEIVKTVQQVQACVGDTCETLEQGSESLKKFMESFQNGSCSSTDTADCVKMCLDETCKLVDKEVAEQGLGALAVAGIVAAGGAALWAAKSAWNKLFGHKAGITPVEPVFRRDDAVQQAERERAEREQRKADEEAKRNAEEQAERERAEREQRKADEEAKRNAEEQAEREQREAEETKRKAEEQAERERAELVRQEALRQEQLLLVQKKMEAERQRQAEEEANKKPVKQHDNRAHHRVLC
ncbi:MAG: hypothetical protein U1E78_01505 [Gammaproteobacteria bacterium]